MTHDRAVRLKVSETLEEVLTYDGVFRFEGGSNSKFDILYDEQSELYISIVNEIVHATKPAARNVLSLAVSTDLKEFKIVKRLIDKSQEDPQQVGLQYVSFLIDGDDLLYLSRTALNGADSYHNSNYITFHRLNDFRKFLD
ncbi:MAG: hypothetical protein ACTIJA_05400 [Bavariicoccus seileri]|uniref:hypothetical protein n=1 Tax=Bavariicoccus seileri TaxID=549685 RepID=UPI003F9DD73E